MKTTKAAIFAGSFDVFTLAHKNIVERALRIFDEVIILVADSAKKKNQFSASVRAATIKKVFPKQKNVRVDICNGLVAEYAKKNNVQFLVRGLRPCGDWEHEYPMAQMNQFLGKDLLTVFITSDDKYHFLSSSLVKEIVKNGGDCSDMVPSPVLKVLGQKGVL